MLQLTPLIKKLLFFAAVVLGVGIFGLGMWWLLAARDKPEPASTSAPPEPEAVVEPVPLTKTLETIYQAGSKDKLITNEYATYNQADPQSALSDEWELSSGSLFAKEGAFWTGEPDTCDAPNAISTNCTNSDIFRANTKKQFTGDTHVKISIKQLKDIHNKNCSSDDTCWHGAHLWLRFQNQYNLYYASLNRADGQVVIKRKVPCGDDNDGTYFTLGEARYDFVPMQWNQYKASIRTNSDQSVTITVTDSQDRIIVSAQDHGGTNPNWTKTCQVDGKYSSAQYPPIHEPGNIGVRGDFSNFMFKDLVVEGAWQD